MFAGGLSDVKVTAGCAPPPSPHPITRNRRARPVRGLVMARSLSKSGTKLIRGAGHGGATRWRREWQNHHTAPVTLVVTLVNRHGAIAARDQETPAARGRRLRRPIRTIAPRIPHSSPGIPPSPAAAHEQPPLSSPLALPPAAAAPEPAAPIPAVPVAPAAP